MVLLNFYRSWLALAHVSSIFVFELNMPRLSLQEKLEILELSRNLSTHGVATEFNRRHPNRLSPLAQTSVFRILVKLRTTGSV